MMGIKSTKDRTELMPAAIAELGFGVEVVSFGLDIVDVTLGNTVGFVAFGWVEFWAPTKLWTRINEEKRQKKMTDFMIFLEDVMQKLDSILSKFDLLLKTCYDSN